MPFTMTMPKLSPTMETGTIVKWHKKLGDMVKAGDVLLEVSTDKATVEHAALDEGYLRKILVQEGGDAAVNEPIAIFTEKADESIASYTPEGVSQKTPDKQLAPEVEKEAASVKTQTGARVVASPLAKKIAQDRGIDLTAISGTGPRGRIVSKDLENAPKQYLKSTFAKENLLPAGTSEEITLTPVRKIISQRLQEAKSTIPHFYITQLVDAENLVNFRKQLENTGIKISFNDCVIKASALSLRDHPSVNAGFNPTKQAIIQFKTVDVSVAVSIEAGLITPIIPHADQKSLTEISEEMRHLAKKAKEGKLAPQEFQGGSFTISNLGMFGITHFQAILNPPQAAILAVGAIQDEPIVRDGKVIAGKVLYLTLSVDHRVVDGVAAAQFLKSVQNYLQNPISLLL